MNLNHIYAVRVRAENAFGVSDPSQPVTSRLLTRSMSFKKLINSTENLIFIINLADEKPQEDKEPISKTKRPTGSAYDDYGSKPSLQVDGPDIQYFLEGQNARITMLLVGYPVPDITWYHDVSLFFIFIFIF